MIIFYGAEMKFIWPIKLRIIFSFGHKKTSVSAEAVYL